MPEQFASGQMLHLHHKLRVAPFNIRVMTPVLQTLHTREKPGAFIFFLWVTSYLMSQRYTQIVGAVVIIARWLKRSRT